MTETNLFDLDTRPRLRSDLRVEDSPRSAFAGQIVDDRFSRRFQLDRVGFAIARLLDGERNLGSILATLEKDGILIGPFLLRKTVTFFHDQLLLEGARYEKALEDGTGHEAPREERVVIRSTPSEAAELPQVFFLEEARHNCIACGMCCRGYVFAPLTDEEAHRLEARPGAGKGGAPTVLEKELQG